MFKLKKYVNVDFGGNSVAKQWIALVLLIGIAYWNLFEYYHEVSGGVSPWRLGDWLINYEAGFIRRGLLGEVFFLAFENINQIFFGIYFLQLLCYLLVVAYVAIRLKVGDFAASDLLLVFSPAFIFVFNFYDPQGGFRKELLMYVAYIFMLLWKNERAKNKWLIFAAFFAYVIAVFSHELVSFFCIFFLRELWVCRQDGLLERKRFFSLGSGFLLTAVVGIFIGLIYPGDQRSSLKICESLVLRGMSPMTCAGAIEWLKFDASYGKSKVALFFGYYIINYPFALLLGLLPFLRGKWLVRNFAFAMVSFLCIIPLFVLATDWGRWINIYITMLTLAFLSGNEKRREGGEGVFLLGGLVFSSSWSFRHCCSLDFYWGIWSL